MVAAAVSHLRKQLIDNSSGAVPDPSLMIRALPSLYSHVREINNLVGYALSTECELSVSTLFYASTTHMFFL